MTVSIPEQQQTEVVQFKDRDGNTYDMATISSISRNTEKSSVSMDIDGRLITVEVTPTEAINIIERYN